MLSECYGSWGWNCSEPCPENYYGGKCGKECTCDYKTQICHPVCGCLKRFDLNYSNMTNNETDISLNNVTSSPYAEECPSTMQVLSTTTGLVYCYLIFLVVSIRSYWISAYYKGIIDNFFWKNSGIFYCHWNKLWIENWFSCKVHCIVSVHFSGCWLHNRWNCSPHRKCSFNFQENVDV